MLKKSNVIYISISLISFFIIGCNKTDNMTNALPNANTPGANQVWVQPTAIVPAVTTVAQNGAITWTNKDTTVLTIISGTPNNPDGHFNSGPLNLGGTFSYTFSTIGTYYYYTKIGGTVMNGTINVQTGYVPPVYGYMP
jgi:plastocyanin